MPRKLLRVALVAAILPTLAPENSSAQTIKPGSVLRTAAPAQPSKKGISGLVQRLKGGKPAPAAGNIVKVSGENAFAEPKTNAGNPFELEGNSDVQLLKSNQPTRRRPTAKVMEFEPAARQETTAKEIAVPNQQPVIAPRNAVEAFGADNPFPDDPQTTPRGRRIEAVDRSRDIATPVATPVEPANDFTAPDAEGEADAFPIEGAAPPADVNADYRSAEGTAPEYHRTNLRMQNAAPVEVPPAPDAAVAPENDARFANPVQAQPVGRLNGGPAVINGPRSALPAYPAPGAPVHVHSGPVGYARLDAALYPSPRQDIPPYVGSTMITNPALDPHEMLYAHRYRGLYGPFYHKTHRSWIMTPFGIYKNEKRILVGTEVRVNYKSSISPFSLFFPPVAR